MVTLEILILWPSCYTLLKVINATANGKSHVIQNKCTECEPSQFGGSRERIGSLQASDPLQAGYIYTLLKVINATANGKTRVIQNKCTECEPSQFGSSREERIAAANEEICNATQQGMFSGQPLQTHLWTFEPGVLSTRTSIPRH